MNKIHYIRLLLIAAFIITLSSCRYSEYLTIDYRLHHGSQWNPDHSQIAFIASKRAYRKPVGMSRFPDGGIPRYIFEEVSAYLYVPSTNKLKELIRFKDLTTVLGSYRSNWNTTLVFTDSELFYHINPVGGWSLYKKNERQNNDIDIESLEKKYSKFYSYHLYSGKRNEIDSARFYRKYREYGKSNEISLTPLNKKLKSVPLKEWGFIVRDIYPKSVNQYVDETIYLKNDCQLTRRAVIEQIISKFPVKRIKKLINKMNQYKNQLEGIKKDHYEINSKQTYQMLQELLDNKSDADNP